MGRIILTVVLAMAAVVSQPTGWAQSAASPAQGAAAPARAATQAPPSAAAQALSKLALDIPFTKYVLRIGLTLVVHEDTKAPVVHFLIWYHVGSKNEPRGQSGFAHLFEHLMYQGSENFNDDFFKATRQVGATSQNGSTGTDRTNYYQTVPKEALDTILWLESDRMGHFLGALTQARLDEQRGVVQNEKRQGQNQPYAIAQDLIIKATYPEGHPYAHSVIGSMEDLQAASLEQVREWFRTYYGPSNAVLVLTGDIKPDDAKARVERFFGSFNPGSPVAHPKTWVAKRTGTQRETAYDRVAAPRLTKVWNIPEFGSRDAALLDMFADVLAADRAARLTKRLVYDEQIATSVNVGAGVGEIAGRFTVQVMGKPAADMARIERIVDEEIARLMAGGPTPSEIEKTQARTIASMVRTLESISTKATILATAQTYLDSPDAWKRDLAVQRAATAAQIAAAAKTWLSDGSYSLTILPFEHAAQGHDVDRKTMPLPAAGSIAAGRFPGIQRTTLSNGLKVMLVERHQAPVVSVELLVDTAYAADFAQSKPGTGGLALALVDEGTTTRDSLALADQLVRIGATVNAGGGGEQSTVSLSALTPTLDQALAIYADVIRNPAYRQADVERVKSQQAAAIRAQRLQPATIANRVLSTIIYGPSHPLGRQTTESSVQSVTREDLVAFHQRWIKPDNAVLLVVGDTTLAQIRPKLESALGSWKASAATPRITVPSAAPRTAPTIYLVDRPGSPQSYIVAGLPAAPRATDEEFRISAFNTNFGGNFTSRINMNLREDKGWSYGVSSAVAGGRGPRMFRITAQVQTDKTKESIQELQKELREVLSTRPLTAAEITTSTNNTVMGLSSRWESSGAIVGAMEEIVTFGLPDTHFDTYVDRMRAVTPEMALDAGRRLIPAQNFAWVVVGDRRRIEAGLRELGVDVRVVNADGGPVE
jgi:zinc protease